MIAQTAQVLSPAFPDRAGPTSWSQATSLIPCGVGLVTGRTGEARFVATALSVAPLSADPPTLILCLDTRGAKRRAEVAGLDRVGVSILAAQHRSLAEASCPNGTGGDDEASHGVEWRSLAKGAIVWRTPSPPSTAGSRTSWSGTAGPSSSARSRPFGRTGLRAPSCTGGAITIASAGATPRSPARRGSGRGKTSSPVVVRGRSRECPAGPGEVKTSIRSRVYHVCRLDICFNVRDDLKWPVRVRVAIPIRRTGDGVP